MAAGVGVKLGLDRLPGGVPDHGILAGFVAEVESEAFLVQGVVVVAVARDAAQPCVLVEGIASGGVGDQGEEVLASQVVDPGKGGPGGLDHVFSVFVVKVSVFHVLLLYPSGLRSLPLCL